MSNVQHVWSRENPTITELRRFCEDIERICLSESARVLFGYLASLSPPVRLARNCTVLAQLIPGAKDWGNVLQNGLTVEERAALCEVDASTLPVRSKEVAHGLLNVHSRWQIMYASRNSVVNANCQRHQCLGLEKKETKQ